MTTGPLDAAPYDVINIDFQDRMVVLTFADPERNEEGVPFGETRTYHIPRADYAGTIAEILDSIYDLIRELEEDRDGSASARARRVGR